MLRRFWSLKWKRVQATYDTYNKQQKDVQQWSAKVIHGCQKYLWAFWEVRNEILHNKTPTISDRQRLEMQVKQLYQDPARYIFLTPEKKNAFT